MSEAPTPSGFQVHALSAREREVVDLAVDGRTDEQISRALGITLSTVNSYWVRIRAKLGPLSRTEVVSTLLQHESRLRHADLVAENLRLRADQAASDSERAQSDTDLRALRSGAWPLLALDHAPDAMVVCRPPGHLTYANLQAQHLFAAEPGELEGLAAWDLAIPEERGEGGEDALGFFEPDGPPRVVLGVDRPLHGQRRDGTNFRAVLVAERFLAPEGPMAVVTVREYLGEAEAILKALRQPYVVR